MSAGGTALAIAIIILVFVMIAIFSHQERQRQSADEVHQKRLLDELKRQPHEEVDEYD